MGENGANAAGRYGDFGRHTNVGRGRGQELSSNPRQAYLNSLSNPNAAEIKERDALNQWGPRAGVLARREALGKANKAEQAQLQAYQLGLGERGAYLAGRVTNRTATIEEVAEWRNISPYGRTYLAGNDPYVDAFSPGSRGFEHVSAEQASSPDQETKSQSSLGERAHKWAASVIFGIQR